MLDATEVQSAAASLCESVTENLRIIKLCRANLNRVKLRFQDKRLSHNGDLQARFLKTQKMIKKYYPRPNLSAPSGTRTRVESMLRVHAQTWEASIIPLDQWRRGVQIWLKIKFIKVINL
jgi:hypothetical protein